MHLSQAQEMQEIENNREILRKLEGDEYINQEELIKYSSSPSYLIRYYIAMYALKKMNIEIIERVYNNFKKDYQEADSDYKRNVTIEYIKRMEKIVKQEIEKFKKEKSNLINYI